MTASALQIKVDWGEVGSTVAFARWSHNIWRCSWFDCEKHSLPLRFPGDAWPFPVALLTLEDANAACARCERLALVALWDTVLQLRAALGRLRGNSRRGREMRIAFPMLGLDIGDRLEPSTEVPHFWMLDELRGLPPGGLRLTCWRSPLQTRCKHRNPVFDNEIGFTRRRCSSTPFVVCP